MSLDQKALVLAQAVGADIGSLVKDIGSLSNLTTVNKQNLVAAINELNISLGSVDLTALINDSSIGTTDAWSASKIGTALNTLKQEILDGAPSSFDTLKEIADYLAANDVGVNDLLTTIGNCVRYDVAQTLTEAQQLQACQNIDIYDFNVNLASFYADSKASTINGGSVPLPVAGASSPEATGTAGNTFAFTASIPDGSSGGVTGNNFAF